MSQPRTYKSQNHSVCTALPWIPRNPQSPPKHKPNGTAGIPRTPPGDQTRPTQATAAKPCRKDLLTTTTTTTTTTTITITAPTPTPTPTTTTTPAAAAATTTTSYYYYC